MCWGATLWIVCFGAPLGSLLLTPGLQAYLRIVFYVLAILQFVGFAVLKIKMKADAWAIFGVASGIIFALLTSHAVITKRRIQARGDAVEPTTLRAVFRRLFFV